MRRIFRRATIDELAAAGKTSRLIEALKPVESDFVGVNGHDVVDLGWERRARAAQHLAEVDGQEAMSALKARLNDRTPVVRLAALRSLAQRAGEHEDAMVEAVLRWSEDDARSQGGTVLVERADEDDAAATRIIRAYVDCDTVLNRTLSHEWVSVVFGAVHGSHRRAVVEHAIATAGDSTVRPQQVLATDQELGVAVLLERLKRNEARLSTVRLLGELHNASAAGPLVEQLRASDPQVRVAAAEALGLIQDPRAAESLLHAAVDPVFEVRVAAQRALDSFGTAGVVWSIAAAAGGALEATGLPIGTGQLSRQLANASEAPPPS